MAKITQEEIKNLNGKEYDEDEALKDIDEFIKTLENGKKEDEAKQNGLNFLLKQWETNKKWFREQSGRVTTEDVIKRTFEFAWASKRNFDYQQEKNN